MHQGPGDGKIRGHMDRQAPADRSTKPGLNPRDALDILDIRAATPGGATELAHRTDAGGEVSEENAVCYLQILLADELPEMGRARMCADMDAWGYTFRLGSAGAWFERDAEDARKWLWQHGLIDRAQRPLWQLRQE